MVVIYNLPGVADAEPRRRQRRGDLPRQDHEVERSGDRGEQRRRDAAGHGHPRRPPLGRLGHDQRLHHLPRHGRRPTGTPRSARARKSSGRPASAPRATTASPARSSRPPGAVGYVELNYATQAEPDLGQHQERRRAVRRRARPTASPPPPKPPSPTSRPTSARRRSSTAPARRPTRSRRTPTCSSTRTRRTPTKGKTLVAFIYWALTDGQAAENGLGYAPLPAAVQQKALDELHTITTGGAADLALSQPAPPLTRSAPKLGSGRFAHPAPGTLNPPSAGHRCRIPTRELDDGPTAPDAGRGSPVVPLGDPAGGADRRSPCSCSSAILLWLNSMLTWQTFGVADFVTGTTWDPVAAIYGALPFIVGTIALVAPRAALRGADRDPDRDLPRRDGAPPDRDPADLHDRAAGRDPERRLRAVGRLRPRPVPAGHGRGVDRRTRSAGSRSSPGRRSASGSSPPGVILAIMILPTIVCDLPRGHPQRPGLAARGDGRPRRDALGDHHARPSCRTPGRGSSARSSSASAGRSARPWR